MVQAPISLTEAQRATLDTYAAELARVTRRINLIAPSTVGQIAERHIAHSLTMARRAFPSGSTVVDWGTGGGLPAVPLAVVFPEVRFVAVDAVGKKTEAVRLFARRLGLNNLEVWNGRAEAYDGPAPHYAVSRATAPLADLWGWFAACREPLASVPEPAPAKAGDTWTPGLICLKGGNLSGEIAALQAVAPSITVDIIELGDAFGDEKQLLHVTG